MKTDSDSPPYTKLHHNTSEFAVADWGTSRFRLWSLSADGSVTGSLSTASGMSTLSKDQYKGVLETAMDSLGLGRHVTVTISGMAGARQGWHEAPYITTPSALARMQEHVVRVPDLDRPVYIVPGVMQGNPANVMRGEETQILGFLQAHPHYDGLVVLPGTHCKWVRVRAGCIEHFETAMTGELFALLSEVSVLKHSVSSEGWDDEAFQCAVLSALIAPARIATELFSIRADMLLCSLPAHTARARLSGMLVGLELAATRDLWRTLPVVLLGAEPLVQQYANALLSQSVTVEILDNEQLTLQGLIHVARQIQEMQS